MKPTKLIKMNFKLSIVLLLITHLVLVIASVGELSKKATPNHQQAADQKANSADAIVTSPSITSVHQVWTSSSSGSLNELSPEIISKLRNDVPFLAAYALRPRLVGASPPSLQVSAADQQQLSKLVQAGSDEMSSRSLDTGASSPQVARQSLVPKLGDFSEFNVETSSTSKSEHHHKRKTSLKRRNSEPATTSGARRRVLAEASELVRRGHRQRNKKQSSTTTSNRKASSSKHRRGISGTKGQRRQRVSNSRRGKSGQKSHLARSDRLRRKMDQRNLQHHMNIIKHGRYLQESKLGAGADSNELDVKMRAVGSDTTTMMLESNGGKRNEADASGVKGGDTGNNKRPFYLGSRQPAAGDDSGEMSSSENDIEANQMGDDRDTKPAGDDSVTESPEGEPDEAAIDDEQREPKRVGDDDVEEEGDTVMVEPKSDGVDDDPPIPTEGDEEDEATASGQGGRASGERESTTSQDDSSSNKDDGSPMNDPRGRRVNRQRPNQPADASTGDGDSGNNDVAVGGGIGSTAGGNSHGSRPGESGHQNDEDGEQQQQGGKGRPTSGVEFAQDDNDNNDDDTSTLNDNEDAIQSGRKKGGKPGPGPSEAGEDGGRGVSNGPKSKSADGESDFGTRRMPDKSPDAGMSQDSDGNKNVDEDDGDLDYRDEIETGRRKSKKKPAGAKGTKEEEPDKSTVTPNKNKDNCDDGSYKHHDEKYHDDHHQTSDWLRGSIPGEPDDDYPVLSRVNSTNFDCGKHKHPGYYADVDTRCQVFHICQADGRQDSFLCPNGTIFSQKTFVCVWWNGFDCEDAPKYYHLNALLYKGPRGDESSHSAASPMGPLDGAHIKASGMDMEHSGGKSHDGDEESSIDSLIEAMKRRKAKEMAEAITNDGKGIRTMGADDIVPDDEATIQRKSTDVAEDSAGFPEASRLRSRAIPRRKRRASARQAPPKLKSRRVSRNSRRRKLRHGIKPKRRA